jgi:hypothetical protein
MADPLLVYSTSHLSQTVWRAVESKPPTERDFFSYADLGRSAPTADYLRVTAVSMYLDLDGLEVARHNYKLPPESVELDLRQDPRIRYAVTNARTGHVSVWAPPEVLLVCVL